MLMPAIFDVDRYLSDFGINFNSKPGKDGSTIYVLDVCPFDSSHTKGESSIIKAGNGTLYFQCFHNSCQGRRWHDFRQLISGNQKLGVYYSGGEKVPLPPGKSQQKTEDIKDFKPKTITANFDPARLPERKWIVYGSVLMGHVSIFVGPGGVCKSVYSLVMCILVAARGTRSETDLTGAVQQYAKTLVINNEDDQVEMERRIAGVMMAYDIRPSELEGRFFYESGYGARRLICDETEDGGVIRAPFVDRLVAYIKDHGIELVVIDPFVSSHRSNENDNSKIDDVVQIYKSIAAVTGCAIVLVHHTRKSSGDEVPTIEASRGGKALSDGCRAGEIIFPLPQSDKKLFGLSDDEARDIVRMDSGKTNYSRKGAGVYFRLESVKLPNGDWVGVPRRIELKEKTQDKGNRVVEIAQFIATVLMKKTGPEGGTLSWSELKASYKSLAGVGSTKANEEITLLPKDQDKALKTSIYDEQGQCVFCRVWYEKGTAKTSPIMVHMLPEKSQQDKKKESENELFI